MDGLTGSRERCLLVIERYSSGNGEAPTRRELAELLGQKSTKGVNQVLQALQKKGYRRLAPARQKRNIVGGSPKVPKTTSPFRGWSQSIETKE